MKVSQRKSDAPLLFFLALPLCTLQYSNAQSSQTDQCSGLETFTVGGGFIKIPVGPFLLIRRNGQIGAIRLTSLSAGSTDWLGNSEYESYVQGLIDGSPTFNKGSQRTGKLVLKAPKGPGRGIYIYQPGTYKATVGLWKFAFSGPNTMAMSAAAVHRNNGDGEFEFAPTSACDLSEVNASAAGLQWFHFDPNFAATLRVRGLPK